ncbi:MAG: hypothetical protein RLP44_01765 [Aggregatilineales bacterium]
METRINHDYDPENYEDWISKKPSDLLRPTVSIQMQCITMIERIIKTIYDNPDIDTVTTFDWREDVRLKDLIEEIMVQLDLMKNITRTLARYSRARDIENSAE